MALLKTNTGIGTTNPNSEYALHVFGDTLVVGMVSATSFSGDLSGDVTGAVGSVTGNVGGNVGGNVVGSVASVTGNVGGNVTGNIEGSVLGNISFASTAGIATYTSQWDVVNSTDSSEYEFTGPGNLDSTGNPTLFLTKGEQYKFNINADGHNFWIKTQTGTGIGNSYNTGVVGNGTTNTTITWDVPFDAPDILYYQCQNHTDMNGTINLTTGGGVGSSDDINTTGIITAGNFNTTGVSTASKFVSTTSNDKFLESSSGEVSFYNRSLSFTPTSTTPTAQIHTFPASDILAADYFMLSEASISGTTYRQSEKVSIVHDGTTAYESEYAVTHTGNRLFSIETALSGGSISVTYRSTSVGYSTQHSIKVLRIGMRT